MKTTVRTASRSLLLPLLTAVFLLALTGTASAAPIPGEELQELDSGVHIQTYLPPDLFHENERHTIYWVKGVKPPMMSHDVSNYGTEGYFVREAVAKDSPYYSYKQAYAYTGGNPANYIPTGYWDVNKTNHAKSDQGTLCYMATAANMLHWWMEQNQEYVTAYKARLENGTMHQEEGLIPLDGTVLDNLMAPPPLIKDHLQEGYDSWMQTIPSSKLSGQYLYPIYKSRDAGGWMDSVFGFFFNGYSSANQGAIPIPDKYTPDPNGGFFYPIFRNTPLAVRYELKDSSFYNTKFKEWILDEKGIGISFKPNSGGTHAVTLWGVEYDEYDNICRIFITDSDDAQFYISQEEVDGAPISQVLYSFDVELQGDQMYLTANHQKLMDMDGAVELSLRQDVWEKVLADPNPKPKPPVNITASQDQIYGSGATADPLEVTASLDPADADMGAFLSYQWYRGDSPEGPWEKLSGKTGSSYRPTIGSTPGTVYYQCEVISHKYGNLTSAWSHPIAVTTTSEPARNAETPSFQSMEPRVLTCNQGETPPAVTVNASVRDGGTLYYQWFYEDHNTIDYNRPVAAPSTSNQFYPPTDKAGEHHFFCIVTNKNPHATGSRSASLDLVQKKGVFLTVTVKAQKPSSKCTVTFATPGATSIPAQTIPSGSVLKLPEAPARPGYSFSGWFLDDDMQRPVPSPYAPISDTVLYAGWTPERSSRGQEYQITDIQWSGGTASDSMIEARISIINLASVDTDQLIAAAYDENGRMVSLTAQTLNPAGSHAGDVLAPVSVRLRNDGTAVSLKAFILPDTGNAVPLSNALAMAIKHPAAP